MTDFAEMVPTQEDLELLFDTLMSQDAMVALGTCDDYKDDEGYCKMCTALDRLQSLIWLMRDEDAWIGTK